VVRTTWKLIALAALSAAAVAAAASPAVGQDRRLTAAKALEVSLLAEVNEVRRANGVPALRLSPQLAAAATTHSRAMALRGFFAHTSADGTPFSRRVARFYGPAGHRYWSVGENLLWSTGDDLAAARAVQLWLRSPAHRRNLLSPRWREVGFSAVVADDAPGTFGGRTVVIVTANFGVRR
jgi:uncharacterized protein YkwD